MSESPGRIRRLLVITYHFPPDGAVGGLRWAGMSKYLARRGWEVHIVTAAPQGDIQPPPGVRVHYTPRTPTLDGVYNAWMSRARSKSPGDKPAVDHFAEQRRRNLGLLGRVRSTASMALAFPDFGRGWILSAAAKARALLREQEFDAVISSGPPHSSHLSGTFACAGRRDLLWLDMRDPWSGMAEALYAFPVQRTLVRWLERIVFSRRPRIVTNTAGFAEWLRAEYPQLHVSFVPNGIDVERLPAPASKKFDGLSIAYAGSLYLGRDLTAVLRAMRDFRAKQPDAARVMKLRIAGNMDVAHEAEFRREVEAGDLGEMVETLGSVSGAEALDLINRSHLTLVLAQNQPMQVPAKIYECVAMKIPTLVITESTSASAMTARRIGAMTHEPTDVDGIRQVLERLWNKEPLMRPAESSISYDDIAGEMDAVLRGASKG